MSAGLGSFAARVLFCCLAEVMLAVLLIILVGSAVLTMADEIAVCDWSYPLLAGPVDKALVSTVL